MIDASAASYVADAVEHFTALEAAFTEVRWRMLRGEHDLMYAQISEMRRRVRKLTSAVDMLRFALEQHQKENPT